MKNPLPNKAWFDKYLDGVMEGSRHDTAVKLAGRWWGLRLRPKEVAILLRGWNQLNQPPLTEYEMCSILKSTLKWWVPLPEDYRGRT